MPSAGLSAESMLVLTAAVRDPDVVRRYRSKVRRVMPGSSCLWWQGAISGRGHGRFWVGQVGGRDLVVIAHRFAWALAHGVSDLDRVPVLGHRCDNPLCQRIAPGHVEASSAERNRAEWAMRRHTVGAPLRDLRGSRGRSRALRDALRSDPTSLAVAQADREGRAWDLAQLPLWTGGERPELPPAEAVSAARIAVPRRSTDQLVVAAPGLW